MFEEPLLGDGGWVAGVHEDPVVTFTAVHAAATHGVEQGLVLQNTEAVSQEALGTGAEASNNSGNAEAAAPGSRTFGSACWARSQVLSSLPAATAALGLSAVYWAWVGKTTLALRGLGSPSCLSQTSSLVLRV